MARDSLLFVGVLWSAWLEPPGGAPHGAGRPCPQGSAVALPPRAAGRVGAGAPCQPAAQAESRSEKVLGTLMCCRLSFWFPVAQMAVVNPE